MGYTIDIDTGGTFTDGFIVVNGRAETVKVPTTPHDLTLCFLDCIKAGASRFGLAVEDLLFETEIIRFSNTIGTNTIIQRDGSKIGLLVTSGQEGLAPTQSEEGLPPLILPDMVLGLDEEVTPAGEVLKSPGGQEILKAAQELIDRGARALVVAFARSEHNPANERAVRQCIKREYPRDFLGSVPVFLSSDISRRSGDVERINAAVLNGYIHAKLVRLLYKAGEELRLRLYPRSLFVVHNNGGVARVAKTRAIHTYNSGPAAGLLGSGLIGKLYGADDLISADMGGTSFDLGYLRRGQPSYSLHPDVEGFRVNVPMLSIRAIGAGGGSIAAVRDGQLRVGPQSAGALPGPACFDLGGTEPTVTDADLILGILAPDYFLGGAMRLNVQKARAAVEERVARPLGIPVEKAALAIRRSIDKTMGVEVKKLRGEALGNADPLLVVYGGAGPAHCCDVAAVAGLRRMVITPFSAVFSAFSSSSMDVGHIYYRRLDLLVDEKTGLGSLGEPVAAMQKEADRDMRGEGFPPERVSLELELFFRTGADGREVKMIAGTGAVKDKDEARRALARARESLGLSGSKEVQEMFLTMVGLVSRAPVPHYSIHENPAAAEDVESARKGARLVFLEEKGAREVPVYERSLLRNGHRISGPALIESPQTTILVQSGWRLRVDAYDNALLEGVA